MRFPADFPSRFTTLPPQSAYSREYSDLYASENQEQVTLKTEAQPGNTPGCLQWAL